MYVCMYVCMYVYMYVCMFVCVIYIYIYIYIYICQKVSIYGQRTWGTIFAIDKIFRSVPPRCRRAFQKLSKQ